VAFTHSEKTSPDPHAYSAIHSVLSGLIPAQDYFTIRLKTDKLVNDSLADKILMKRNWHGKNEVLKATGNGDWY